MALFGLKALADPAILAEAKAEFDKDMAGQQYICPIPDGVLPPAD
jgi:aminobenzoyl-glutamate utilization protein B